MYAAFTADDAASQDNALKAMQDCICDVRQWMLSNNWKLMTEFLLIGSKQQLQKVTIQGVWVGCDLITPVTSVRNLGVIFDQHLRMDKHITKICSTAYFHLHNIRCIRKYLSHEAVCMVIHAFSSSQSGYCNSRSVVCHTTKFKKLQRLQNCAAILVLNIKISDHITPALQDLHWLPVKLWMQYKIYLTVFKALHGLAPLYIYCTGYDRSTQ